MKRKVCSTLRKFREAEVDTEPPLSFNVSPKKVNSGNIDGLNLNPGPIPR